MKISIITPSFNSGNFLKATIKSIQEQSYRDFEHIVIDGLSSDNTIEILKQYQHIKWVSEKDSGQSDAINKGFVMATGDILAWQNADDLYFSDTFEIVTQFFQANPQIDLIYGDYQLIDESGNWVCDVQPPEWNEWLFAHGRFVPLQPTVFWRRSVYENIGDLNLALHYCMDVDLFARAAKNGFRFKKVPAMLGKFRMHDASKTQGGGSEGDIYAEHKNTLSQLYNYSLLDNMVFNFFYYRAKLAKTLKRKLS